jgi:hypothetical protein
VTLISLSGLDADPLDLVVGAVNERDPGALVFGVASVCLLEYVLDDGSGVMQDAGAQPLVFSDRSRGGVMFALVGEDVCRAARRGRGVVDRADLSHPLAKSLLAAGQPSVRSGPGPSRLGGRAQSVGTDHDPFAVGREHQHLAGVGALRAPGLIEVLKVDGGQLRELLHLAAAQPLPRRALNRVHRVLEAATGGLQRG